MDHCDASVVYGNGFICTKWDESSSLEHRPLSYFDEVIHMLCHQPTRAKTPMHWRTFKHIQEKIQLFTRFVLLHRTTSRKNGKQGSKLNYLLSWLDRATTLDLLKHSGRALRGIQQCLLLVAVVQSVLEDDVPLQRHYNLLLPHRRVDLPQIAPW